MIALRSASSESEEDLSDRQRGWKILHVDVADVGDLSLESCYDGLYICFWYEGRPLGHCQLSASDLPLSQTQARSLAVRVTAPAVHAYLRPISSEVCHSSAPPVATYKGPLKRLSESWRRDGAPRGTENISLVICTRNRPVQLERCLRSVAALNLQPLETIVVDNGSSSGETRRVATSWQHVRYVWEPCLGLGRARNAGIRTALSPLIAFTDDDIVVSPDWLSHLARALEDPRVTAASGLVLPAELRTKAQILFEHGFGWFNQGYEPRLIGPEFIHAWGRKAAPVWSICAGGNMMVRRETFDRIGFFDRRLGAGASGCSEDSEFWYRMLAHGGSCAYVPAAVVMWPPS
jgi:cellulose synthase/poly-beta-1,6-N-acetylglucosamine synthase-like glycosyltransferase